MMVELGRIVSGDPLRRQPVAAAADQALALSIATVGVLAPVLLRPARRLAEVPDAPMPVSGTNQMLKIVSGHRRVAAARAAGLTQIPAEVRDMNDAEAVAAQAADNALREALHPVDAWLAAQAMRAQGMSAKQAAGALGMTERELGQMTWLAGLHPAVLDLCRLDMPELRDLRRIALASQATQQAATERKDIRDIDDDDASVQWWVVVNAWAPGPRPSRNWAMFDHTVSNLTWDEDLFAEPGSDEQFTTADRDGFLALQRQAMQATAGAQKKTIFIEQDPKTGRHPIPAGFEPDYGAEHATNRHTIALVLHGTGRPDTWYLLKQKQDAAPASGSIEDDNDTDDSPDTAQPEAPPVPDAAEGMSKEGLALIAARKTQAVKAALMAGDQIDAHDLLALLVLAFAADNATVRGADPLALPGCRIKLGDERRLLGALRDAEAELARCRAEDSDTDRRMAQMASEHGAALRAAEEAGYAKGLEAGLALLDQIEADGRKAYQDGKEADACPYDEGTRRAIAWLVGWAKS